MAEKVGGGGAYETPYDFIWLRIMNKSIKEIGLLYCYIIITSNSRGSSE